MFLLGILIYQGFEAKNRIRKTKNKPRNLVKFWGLFFHLFTNNIEQFNFYNSTKINLYYLLNNI